MAHRPVMLEEVINYLNLKKGDVALDATIGLGGHATRMLKRISPGGLLIGIDADRAALEMAEEALKGFEGSFKLINDNFRDLDIVLQKEGVKALNAVLFDLGISSYQIESEHRGFSIKQDSRLDMRMDERSALTAYDIVNTYSEKGLSALIEKFGEERFHNRIAKFIVEERSRNPIHTTHELAEAVHRAIGYRHKTGGIDPATRTFQAIRIAVNDELGSLEEGLKRIVSWLAVGARICVISFHSLEDRIVKNLFREYAELGFLNIVTKKPIIPSDSEIESNPRSRSAKLRVAERL